MIISIFLLYEISSYFDSIPVVQQVLNCDQL